MYRDIAAMSGMHLSLQCTRHHSELHYSVRAYNKMSLIYFLVVTMYTHMFNIYVACPWPHSSAVKRCLVWDFSTHWVIHSLISSGFLMTVQCRGAWLKTNSPLSEARKTRLNINCVGSLNEHGSLRLFLNIHLSHRKGDISVRRWHKKYFWSHVQNLQERKI